MKHVHTKYPTSMFIVASFIIVKMYKPPKCPSINKICYIYTMEYYLARKRNEEMIHATTWIGLENIMLSERRLKDLMYEFLYVTCPE